MGLEPHCLLHPGEGGHSGPASQAWLSRLPFMPHALPPEPLPGRDRQPCRLCWKCQPHLAERPLLALTRPLADGVAREQLRARPLSLWAWPFLASLSQLWLQPQEANQKVSWGWGAISRGAGLKWSCWVGSWVGSALSKGSRRYGLRAWVQNELGGNLTLTSPSLAVPPGSRQVACVNQVLQWKTW